MRFGATAPKQGEGGGPEGFRVSSWRSVVSAGERDLTIAPAVFDEEAQGPFRKVLSGFFEEVLGFEEAASGFGVEIEEKSLVLSSEIETQPGPTFGMEALLTQLPVSRTHAVFGIAEELSCLEEFPNEMSSLDGAHQFLSKLVVDQKTLGHDSDQSKRQLFEGRSQRLL